MSIENTSDRTLNGANSIIADSLVLPKNNKYALFVGNDKGIAGQTLQKDENNKLKWGFIDNIEIPDGSIEGSKLAPNINISTTGDITAHDITATHEFNQTDDTATNTFDGELVVKKLYTTKEDVEAIRVQNGGIIHIMENDGGSPDPAIMVSLSGVNGNVFCNQIRSNQIAFPQSGTTEVILNEDGLVLTPNATIDADGSRAELKNLLLYGGTGLSANQSIVCLGGITTGTDSAGNEGSLQMNTGGITLTLGDLILSNATSIATLKGELEVFGNSVIRGGADFIGDNAIDFIDSSTTLQMRISPDTGNITNPNGKLTLSKSGATPPPTDSSTYTDWAIDVNNNDGHIRVGGNIICDGTIYGSVEGAITEEEVDCQRLTLRTATPPLSGITGMIMGAGSIISNDTSGNLELTIDADTSGILANNLSIIGETTLQGNTNIGTGAGGITTTIGSTSSNDSLVVETTTTYLGSSTGIRANNRIETRGGIATFNGDKLEVGTVPQGTDPPAGTSLEGTAGIQTNNIYRNEIKNFNINGRYISHDLAGTTQNFVIYRATSEKGVEVPSVPGFSGTSTSYLQPLSFSFVDLVAPTNCAKITIQSYYRHYKGNPDLRCRIDETSTGATPYSAQVGGPRIVKNSVSNSGNEQIHKYDFILSGLIEGNTYSFYPKFAHTTSGRGFLCYGGAFGEMYMYIEWIEFYNGVVKDPYSAIPTGEEVLGETLHSLSYVDNESQNFTRIYNTSNKWIFDGNQNSGTDTLEAHFTATTTSGYIEFGFYANSLTSGMVFMCGIASATGGTSPFATTIGSGAVSIDAYKLGLFNGDTSQYSLKELLDFTSYENTYITSKFHFNNLTIGTEYKMALYGRCHNSGSIYINAGGKSSGTTNRSAHQQAYIKFYSYDTSIGGARTDDPYVPAF
jgi:hypothetical protein